MTLIELRAGHEDYGHVWALRIGLFGVILSAGKTCQSIHDRDWRAGWFVNFDVEWGIRRWQRRLRP